MNKALRLIFSFLFLSIVLFPQVGWGNGKCKMNIKTTITDGDEQHVKLKVEVTDAVDANDCKAQATSREVSSDPEHKMTIKVTYGFRPN